MRIVIVHYLYEKNERNGAIAFGSNWFFNMSDGDALLMLRSQLDKQFPDHKKYNFQWGFHHITENQIRNIAKELD